MLLIDVEHTKVERRRKDQRKEIEREERKKERKKKIQAQLLTLAQCDGVVRRAEIASELSIKVIFPKSG